MVLAHRPLTADIDRMLVRRAQAGDRDAFAELMAEHGETVRRLVRRFVQDGDDARDVEQDAWIKAATNLDSLRDQSSFRPWLKAIARNVSLTFVTNKQRERGRVSSFDDCGTEDFEDRESATPEAHILSRDSQRKVWEALGALSERDRTALYLREYKDQPYDEIAKRFGISRNAAEVCVFRARERFRMIFADIEEQASECGLDGLRLSMLLDRETSDEARASVEAHVRECAPCETRLTTMTAGQAVYRNLGALGMPIPGLGLVERIADAVGRLIHSLTNGSDAGASSAVGTAAAAGTATAGGVAVVATGTAGVATGVTITGGAAGFIAAAAATAAVAVGAVMQVQVTPASAASQPQQSVAVAPVVSEPPAIHSIAGDASDEHQDEPAATAVEPEATSTPAPEVPKATPTPDPVAPVTVAVAPEPVSAPPVTTTSATPTPTAQPAQSNASAPETTKTMAAEDEAESAPPPADESSSGDESVPSEPVSSSGPPAHSNAPDFVKAKFSTGGETEATVSSASVSRQNGPPATAGPPAHSNAPAQAGPPAHAASNGGGNSSPGGGSSTPAATSSSPPAASPPDNGNAPAHAGPPAHAGGNGNATPGASVSSTLATTTQVVSAAIGGGGKPPHAGPPAGKGNGKNK